MATSKELNKLRRELKRKGWRIEKGRKHFKCYGPNGEFVAMSTSPSDPNAHHQARREIAKLERKNENHPPFGR